MRAGKVSTMKAVALGVAVMFIIASCGSSDSASGGRTKNSALCFDTQADKDAAIKTAQAELDAAAAAAAAGAAGGYRRPAVRSMSGDTTVPLDTIAPTSDTTLDTTVPSSDTTVVDSGPNIPMLEQALAVAEAQPLCDAADAGATPEFQTIDCPVDFKYYATAGYVLVKACDAVTKIETRTGNYGGMSPYSGTTIWMYSFTSSTYTIYVGDSVIGTGIYNVSDGDVTVNFQYQVAAPPTTDTNTNTTVDGSSDSTIPGEATDCTATFTSTGVSWDCQSGERFNAAFEDSSNPGVYPSVECASSGSFTVAYGQPFWFYFYLVNGPDTFLDGLNRRSEQNVPLGFNVPEDTEGVCAEVDTPGEVESFDWASLPFKGTLDPEKTQFIFTVPEDLGKPVYMQVAGVSHFGDVWGNNLGFNWDCSSTCTANIAYDFAPGEYFFSIVPERDVAVTWSSNVEISAVQTVFPVLPFSYTSDGSSTRYEMKLSAAQTVTLTATAGQTCLASEDDDEGNGFADPELWIHGSNGVDVEDDNSGRGVGNCSASLIEIELEPGTYTVGVEDVDQEGGSITLGSSVKLTALGELTWNLASSSVSPDATFEIVVPAGGSWFKANTVLDQTDVHSYDEATDERIDATGCEHEDSDGCADSYLVLLDANDEEVISDDDGGGQYSQSTSNGIRTQTMTNYLASDFFLFLEEGTYTLGVMHCCGPWYGEEPSTDVYQVNFGFGSFGAQAPQVEVVIDENPTIPASVEQPKLPDAQLSVAGSASASLAEGVDSMVCDTSCIEGLFASAGFEDGTMSISAGGESIVVYKGEKAALIPIGKNASAIIARAVSADGSKTATLSMKLDRADAALEKAMQEKVATGAFQSASGSETSTSSSTSGSSKSMYVYVLIALVILMAIGYMRRKKATPAN